MRPMVAMMATMATMATMRRIVEADHGLKDPRTAAQTTGGLGTKAWCRW